MMRSSVFLFPALLLFVCVAAQQPQAVPAPLSSLLARDAFSSAFVGVSIYDPATGSYLADHQGDKYFIPASNVKIATCYLAMKYLKDTLPGIRYYENDTAIYLLPTGDPTLLHRDFPDQPVIRFLQAQRKKIYISDLVWKDKELGKGWSWDDFSDEFMTERNALPVYGNTIRWVQDRIRSNSSAPELSASVYADPEVNWKVRFGTGPEKTKFNVERERLDNVFVITEGPENHKEVFVPFMVKGIGSALELLKDTIGKEIRIANSFLVTDPQPAVIWSHPLDEVLRPMMYHSDNFFAEQLLLMVSAQRLGVMDAAALTDTVLKTDFEGLPQPPVWVDGSGLSRYNLFSPRDFVSILSGMRKEFGMERLKSLFPPGDSGTLRNYYTDGNPYIYAKTGSMSGVIALSGFLYTRKKKELIFSVLVNNYKGSGTIARREIEKFIRAIRDRY